jgi:transcriptional regulator with XRE-family HTH domain
MAGRPKRITDIELATRLHNWRLGSDLTHSFVADRLGVAVSTVTRSLKTNSFSADMQQRVLALLKEDDGTDGKIVERDRFLADGISQKDLRFLQKFVKLIPKAEVVLRSALRRRSGGLTS